MGIGPESAGPDKLERERIFQRGDSTVVLQRQLSEAWEEIERLRVAGNGLRRVRAWCACIGAADGSIEKQCPSCKATIAWDEVCRG